MDCISFQVAFLVLGPIAGGGTQPKAGVLDPEAARDALIRFVRQNPKAREAPAHEEDLRKAKITMEKDGTFTIHGVHVDPKTKSYSRVVVTGLGPMPGGTISQATGSFRQEDTGRWVVVNATFSYTCILAPPRPPGN